MRDTTRLTKLAATTRDLLDDLDHARAELLSVADLNRALRQVLRNQVAVLEALASEPPKSEVQAQIKVRPTTAAAPSASAHNGRANGLVELAAPAVDEVAPLRGEVASLRPNELTDLEAEVERAASGQATVSNAEAYLGEARVIPEVQAAAIVEQFDNRDKDYGKGLEKLNRWLTAGSSGTPFQWRGDRAYLNLSGAGPTTAKNYEEQLMTKMGFSRRIGRLVLPGLEGEVVVYERPNQAE